MNWTGKQLKKQSSGLRMSRFWNFFRRNIPEDSAHMMEKKDRREA